MKKYTIGIAFLSLVLVSCGSNRNVDKQYTVVWKNWDGSILEVDLDQKYGDIPQYNGDRPYRPDDEEYSYKWVGWSPSLKIVTSDITYTAVFSENKILPSYQITFETNGGSELSPLTVSYGERIDNLPVPSREGFIFEGWFKDEECQIAFLEDECIFSDLTLYAKWAIDEKAVIMQEINTSLALRVNKASNCEIVDEYVVTDFIIKTSYQYGTLVEMHGTTKFSSSYSRLGNHELIIGLSILNSNYAFLKDMGYSDLTNLSICSIEALRIIKESALNCAIQYSILDGVEWDFSYLTSYYLNQLIKNKFLDEFISFDKNPFNRIISFDLQFNDITFDIDEEFGYVLKLSGIINVNNVNHDFSVILGITKDNYLIMIEKSNNDLNTDYSKELDQNYSHDYLIEVYDLLLEKHTINFAFLIDGITYRTSNFPDPYDYATSPTLSSDGNSLFYGLYPQKYINNPFIINELNKICEDNDVWALFKGHYYVKKVVDYDYVLSGNVVANGSECWFRCDPIEWSIVEATTNNYYVFAVNILDGKEFYHWDWSHGAHSNRIIDGKTIYDTNYEYSDIRKWLNSEFFNTAFSLNKYYVNKSYVYNDESTTYCYENVVCNDTTDNVLLPCYADFTDDGLFFKKQLSCSTYTDWAIAGNVYYGTTYWTRSPRSEDDVWYVNAEGVLRNDYTNNCLGIRPAVALKKY